MAKYVMMLLCAVQVMTAQESPHGKIKFECTTCHSTDSWKVNRNAIHHEITGFALTGAHKAVQCESCHKGLKFAATKSSDCLSCHTDIHKSELGTNCLRCHTTQAWKIADMIQKHQATRFPLLGKHATLACQTCHANAGQKQYAGTPTDCFGCHQNDFRRTLTPNHIASGFSTNCAQCHQVTSFAWNGWFVHERPQLATPTQCVACHKVDFTATASPNHAAARFSTDCKTCHQSTRTWTGARFDHNQTRFPLIGAHQAQQCADCHSDNVFVGKATDCVACHRNAYNSATNPNHVAGNFSTACQTCHAQTAWRPATFDHSGTRFPLTGAHRATACQQCHANGQFANTPLTCVGCHQANFNGATNPSHRTGSFTTNCVECHATSAWRPASFNHATTSFPLTGAHVATQCQLCHTSNNYQLQYTNCFPCHQAQYNQPANPRHVQPSFGQDCTPCHTTSVWRPSTFNHANTSFQLVGAHQTASCNQCHLNNQYQNLPHTCWDCHAGNYNSTTNPNHQQGQFSHDCQSCHSQSSWSSASFNHSTTNFPLTGAHVTTQCTQCHVNGNYQLVYTNCYACHQTEYNQPTNPRHVQPSFGQDCTPCHTTSVWRPSTFNHANTSFQLVGAHQTVACNQCHVNNQYQNLPHTCWDCHAGNYNSTTNPNHQQGQFSHDCLTCHSQTSWSSASFNHSTTNFPLTGAHVTLQCVQCHVNGNYQLVYTNCYPCHTTQYAQPQNPNHVLGNFNHDCTPCHTTTVWHPSTFNHANTVFPLVGAHQTVACNQCHVNNQYQNLPHTCWDCHAGNYNATTNPNHQQGQFSHDCLTCHTQTAWQPASFNHSTTNFPLTGAHVTTQCIQCHVNGNYQLVYTNCYPCHTTRYAQPQNPNHVLGNFNHDCTPCHTTSAWLPSTFNHGNTVFPLVGAHQAVSCNQCHVNNQYQNLPHTCWDCHAADFNGTTNPNHQQGQFSHECLTCHTQSAWRPATFNHSTTNFPLTGAHVTTSCIQCHVNGNYQLTYTNCYQCHATDFQQVTNPNHVAQQFSHTCAPCHSTSVWTPNTMNHDAAWFRIYSGHHRNRWTQCSQCHTTIGNLSAYSCTTGCHQNAHHQGQDCYSCHRNA